MKGICAMALIGFIRKRGERGTGSEGCIMVCTSREGGDTV